MPALCARVRARVRARVQARVRARARACPPWPRGADAKADSGGDGRVPNPQARPSPGMAMGVCVCARVCGSLSQGCERRLWYGLTRRPRKGSLSSACVGSSLSVKGSPSGCHSEVCRRAHDWPAAYHTTLRGDDTPSVSLLRCSGQIDEPRVYEELGCQLLPWQCVCRLCVTGLCVSIHTHMETHLCAVGLS